MQQLILRDIYLLCKKIRLKAQNSSLKLYTNMYQYYNKETEDFLCDYRLAHSSLIFSYCDKKNVNRVYFVSFDLRELSNELAYFPQGSVIDFICKGKNALMQSFYDGGFTQIGVYTRKSTNFLTDGKDFKRSHSEILEAYYDETIGEYASEEDAEEIADVLDSVFDKDVDHIPTIDEIREYISKKWVLIYRISGKIRCLYIFQIEGRKFYSNFSYNSLPAIVLYCLEKRAHIDVLKKYDVIMKYSWINIKNENSLKRNILKYDDIYIYIFKKV